MIHSRTGDQAMGKTPTTPSQMRLNEAIKQLREELRTAVRDRESAQDIVFTVRARMILHAADNIGVRESARELDVWPKTVRYWRGRWRQAPAAQSVSERLADAPRSNISQRSVGRFLKKRPTLNRTAFVTG